MRRLDNPVRRYAWGSVDAIPDLVGSAPDGGPQAELWMGAHERDSSRIDGVPLVDLVSADPQRFLGPSWAPAGRLPFLAKLVAVAEPLSLQVHPKADLARRQYRAEEAAGIDRDSEKRSFPDDVAKVELVYAVSPFRALCGFRPLEDVAAWLDRLDVPALQPTAIALCSGGREALLAECERLLLDVDPAMVVPRLVERCTELLHDPAWAPSARPLLDIALRYPHDPAVALAVLLQPVQLEPGHALIISPGQPHTYLAGTAFEVQANSDNVLRAGLTSKHIDVPALLQALDPEDHGVATVVPRQAGPELVFPAGRAPFALSVIDARRASLPALQGPQLFCSLDGEYELVDRTGTLRLRRGEAAFAAADAGEVRVEKVVPGRGTLVRVTPGRAG